MPLTVTQEVLDVMQDHHPKGLTARQLAQIKGWKETKSSWYMGQLFFAGMLDRCRTGETSQYRYVFIPKPEPAPPLAPLFPVRLAERMIRDDHEDDRRDQAAAELARQADRLIKQEAV